MPFLNLDAMYEQFGKSVSSTSDTFSSTMSAVTYKPHKDSPKNPLSSNL